MYQIPGLTADRFESEVLRSPVPVLLSFGAPWCPACRIMDSALAALSEHYQGYLRVYQVSVDDPEAFRLREQCLWPLDASFSVNLIPLTLVFDHGELVKTIHGAQPAVQVAQELAARLPQGAPPPPAAEPTAVQLSMNWQAGRGTVALPLTEREVHALDNEQGRIASAGLYKDQRFPIDPGVGV